MNTERELIRDLANALASTEHAYLIEAGGKTGMIGEPLGLPDSPLGRAAKYLGKPVPLVPSWEEPEPESL